MQYHIVIASGGRYMYSYKEKFVKYSYTIRKVVMRTDCAVVMNQSPRDVQFNL